jgi:hypothetical protein
MSSLNIFFPSQGTMSEKGSVAAYLFEETVTKFSLGNGLIFENQQTHYEYRHFISFKTVLKPKIKDSFSFF